MGVRKIGSDRIRNSAPRFWCSVVAGVYASIIVSTGCYGAAATSQLQTDNINVDLQRNAALFGNINGSNLATPVVSLPANIGGYKIPITRGTSMLVELRLIRECLQCIYRILCFVAGSIVFWCAISKVFI